MNFFLKQKVWFFVSIFLLVVNIVTIVTLFSHKHKHHSDFGHYSPGLYHRDGGTSWQHENFRHNKKLHNEKRNKRHLFRMKFLAEKLNFSEEQKNKLEKINKEIESKKDSLFEKQEDLKRLFSRALYSENVTTQHLESLIKAISSNSESYNWLRIEKANKIKALCTDEQKAKLGTVFNEWKFGNHRLEKR